MRRLISALVVTALVVGLSACMTENGSQQDGTVAPETQRAYDPESETSQQDKEKPITEEDFDIDAILDGLVRVHAATMKVIQQMEPPGDHAYLPTKEEYRMMSEEIGELGVPVAGYQLNMPNYQQVVDFCRTVEAGGEDSLILYRLSNTASIAEAFYTRGGKVAMMTGYYSFPYPDSEEEVDPPHVENLYHLSAFALTEKGYLSYTQIDPLDDSLWGNLYRVLPYDDKLMELTERYPLEFDRYFSNLMDCNWDARHLEDLHLLEIFITFYTMYNSTEGYPNPAEAMGAERYGDPASFGENDVYHYGLPALLVEETLKKHLPVTTEYLRALPEYDADLMVYDWGMVPRGNMPPTPEVVDYDENEDGSLTLYIDAVGENSGNDRQWSIVLTVRDNPDGSVFYQSCSTTFYDVYPYAYLQDQPVLTDPEELAGLEDAAYRRFSQLIGPYVGMQPQYEWAYPGDGKDLESRMLYVIALIQNGSLESEINPAECYNAGNGTYELPRQGFDRYLLEVFDGLVVDDTLLAEQNLLDNTKTHYRLVGREPLFDGAAYLNWVNQLQDDRMELTVHCYDSDEKYLCQLTFDFEPWGDSIKIYGVKAVWMGAPPARP